MYAEGNGAPLKTHASTIGTKTTIVDPAQFFSPAFCLNIATSTQLAFY